MFHRGCTPREIPKNLTVTLTLNPAHPWHPFLPRQSNQDLAEQFKSEEPGIRIQVGTAGGRPRQKSNIQQYRQMNLD